MPSAYTIYAYFNAEQINGILNAVVMLMGAGGTDGDYLAIVRVAAILGLFIAIAYGFVRARGEEAGQYVLLMAIFYSTLFVPRVTVTIEEHGGTGGGAPYVVDNVPLGLAFFASTTSHIGYWLTEKTETFFALPETELRLSKHGLMGGARALREAQGASLPDPVLAQDMINFMRDCINPELVASAANVAALLNSTDIWKTIGPAELDLINPGRMVTLAGTAAVTCDAAYGAILGPRLAPAADSEFVRIARVISPSATAADANVVLGSMLPGAEGLIMTASASTTEAIRQRMMINLLNDTSGNMAQILNDPAGAQTALGTAMAASNANSSYRVLAKLAQETLPLVRNAIELVILGVFPIILLLVIIAGSKGGVVLRSYVLTMLWVQLWAPLYAIVNYVGTMAGAKSMKAALAGIDGIAVTNAAALLNSAISSEAIAGILTVSVPMIALALVKGGEVAMSSETSGLTAPASSAATSVGGQVGSGNVSMGNLSWSNGSFNSMSANKTNTDFSYLTGATTTRIANGDATTTFADGTSVADRPTHKGPLAGKVGATTSSTLSMAASEKMESAFNHAVAAGNTALAALQRLTGRGSDNVRSVQTGSGWGNAETGVDGTTWNDAARVGENTTFTQGQERSNAATANGSLSGRLGGSIKLGKDAPSGGQQKAGAAGGSPVTGDIGGSVGAGITRDYRAALKKAISSGDVAEVQSVSSRMVNHLQNFERTRHRESSSKSGSDTARNDISASLNESQSHLHESRAQMAESKALSRAAEVAKRTESGMSYDPWSDPHRTSAKAFHNGSESIARTPVGEIGGALKAMVPGTTGEPGMPKEYMDGKPVVAAEAGLRQDHFEDTQRPEVADGTKAAYRGNARVAGGGPTGTGSVPTDKKEDMRNQAGISMAKDRAEGEHFDNKKAAERAQRIADKHLPMVGRSPRSPNAMSAVSTAPIIGWALHDSLADFGAPTAQALVDAGIVSSDRMPPVGRPGNQPQYGGFDAHKPAAEFVTTPAPKPRIRAKVVREE